jgi:hypothetical protein
VILPKNANFSRILTAVLALSALGAAQPISSGGFGATIRTRDTSSAAIASVETARPQVESVASSPAHLIAGASTLLTIRLRQPAPEGGATVSLATSDDSVVSVPAFVKIPAGDMSTTIEAFTSSDAESKAVTITAFSDSTLAGTSLEVVPAATIPFTLSLHPATVTITPGDSGSSTAKTTAGTGYSHTLKLTAANLPAGVALSFSPTSIPAPGTGSSTANISVGSSVAAGTYSIHVTASDGTHSRSATLRLKVGSTSSSGPGATFQGCWYQSGDNSYQGVIINTANSGTWPFYANLYFGASCDPNQWADDFGLGQLLQFSPMYTWTMWFNHFPNQTAMSAQYQIGSQVSQCINYETVSTCP